MDTYFQGHSSQRYYIHVDKPLYKPGETIWFRLWELESTTFTHPTNSYSAHIQLISPKGATVLEKNIAMDPNSGQPGIASNDFELPMAVQGGEYTLRITSTQGASAERSLIVSTYQPPRIKKKAEFLRKAYGPGDAVSAAISVHRATGEALALANLTAIVSVDSIEVQRFTVKSDAKGNAIVKFKLPKSITTGDGLLTLLVNDGGVTESLQKRIPITLKNIRLEMFPEGGDLVSGLPGRMYFSAKNSMGKAADISGHIENGKGERLTSFRSFHNGMGRYALSPKAGESYFAVIDSPRGITTKYPLPAAKESGCTLQSVDAYQSSGDLKVGVWCSKSQSILATASLRDKSLGNSSYAIEAGKANLLSFPVPIGRQGAVRVTLFDENLSPLAERLVYRGRGNDLKISIAQNHEHYSPRDEVSLTIRAEDLSGNPVQADLSLSVVDDTVLSFADDKSAHLLSSLYLEAEMPGQEIEEPNFYFSEKPKAAPSLDLVLGTQGWRRFAWKEVLSPPVSKTISEPEASAMPMDGEINPAPPPPMAMPAKPRFAAAKLPLRKEMEKPAKAAAPVLNRRAGFARLQQRGLAGAVAEEAMADRPIEDADWRKMGKMEKKKRAPQWTAYRVFPTPNYSQPYDGPRTDFRETIAWQPHVKTDAKGEAVVQFYLNDSITSFRVQAEGVSQGGLPGRVEHLLNSKLPVSLAVKMPLEVSKGDTIRLPIVLENETDRPYTVDLQSEFGPAFRVQGVLPTSLTLKPKERSSFVATLSVVGDGKALEDGQMRIAMSAANLKDEVKRQVRVVPLGFPQEISLSGLVDKSASHQFTITGMIPETLSASLTMYPSPLATMLSGTEAIIREPYGCFEQASSANYPNIMVLDYMEENNAADPELVQKTMGHLDKGYNMLTGYESPKKGFEWFGGDPGHEALTAYGLMEFVDMSKVYGDVDMSMIERTSNWLKSRRDGKGGFKQNKRALDSFGRASAVVTNAYISYALSRTGDTDLAQELAGQKRTALAESDPYVLALAANTLVNLAPDAESTKAALQKLAALQSKSGAFTGADHSITRSGGIALDLETTSLAVMALLQGGDAYTGIVRRSVAWINTERSGAGGFGSTQSTVLTLAALSQFAESTRVTRSGGTATVFINGIASGSLRFEKGHKDALVFDDIAGALKPGKNTIELKLDSESPLPYSIGISYRSKMPASSPKTAVGVRTTLAKTKLPVGEGVRMDVKITNRTNKGQPMTLARVGIPGGLTFQTWQLKELVDKKIIDFYETREREVVLYFRSLAPNAQIQVPLELLARVPGKYVGPASQAYLYYTNEFRDWSEPLTVHIVGGAASVP